MKLNSELTARTILRRQPRTYHHMFINPVLAHLSTPSPLDNPTMIAAIIAIGRIPELLMTEQTHSAYARPRRTSCSLTRSAGFDYATPQDVTAGADAARGSDRSDMA